MKKYKISFPIVVVIALCLLATSCKELDFTYSGPSLVSFTESTSGSYFVEDNSNTVDSIVVGLTTITGSDRTIDFEIDASSSAQAGVHFTIEGSSLTIPANSAIGYIVIKGKYDGFTNALDFKTIKINLLPSSGIDVAQFDNSFTLTLSQLPAISPWLGTYAVSAASYGQPGIWDEFWGNVKTSIDPTGDGSQIFIFGIAGSVLPVSATLDVDAGTITIPEGQSIGDVYEEGNIGIALGDSDLNVFGGDIVGTISSDGSISVDLWGHYSINAGWVWDVFNTSWTKK